VFYSRPKPREERLRQSQYKKCAKNKAGPIFFDGVAFGGIYLSLEVLILDQAKFSDNLSRKDFPYYLP
jgi:hypothetical protein